MKMAARRSVSGSNITAGLMIRPTETRKTGTNTAPPKNSIRSIRSPSLGTRRLRASPAKNAPTMPSMANTSARVAAASMATRAKT